MTRPTSLFRLTICRLSLWSAIAALCFFSGCASTLAPHNKPIEPPLASSGYRANSLQREGVPQELWLSLSFSGGGTRAAALAYGVLEELAKTRVVINGQQRRMLDLVESISAVSGGSYTAAYYGLFGDRIFEDFETKFLKRDVQGQIADEVFSLKNIFRMTSPYFGRSDVTAEFLDQLLFEGKTFADLDQAIRQNNRPFIVINATDMALTSRFEFTQDQFDLLCSDLGSYRISRAVAASSAVPVLFSPITLTNYAGNCAFQEPPWMRQALSERQKSIRSYSLALDLRTYLDSDKRKYIHLLDGGLADNLGLRFMLDRFTLAKAVNPAISHRRPHLRRLVQISVNAQARQGFPELDQYAEVPTLRAIAFSVANTTDRYNVETLAYARSSLDEAAQSLTSSRRQRNPADNMDVQAMLIEIGFDNLKNDGERSYFNALPTSFRLPPEAIDQLRAAGARLLRDAPEYQRLLRDLPALR